MNERLNQFIKLGIQFEIFNRVLNSVRHSMLSPLSTSRMRTHIISRKLKSENIDEKLIESIDILDNDLIECVLAIKKISIWDKNNLENSDVFEVISMSLKLMSINLSLKNIQIAFTKSPEIIEVQQLPFLYLILGILCYFVDYLPESSIIELHVLKNQEITFILKSGDFLNETLVNSFETNTYPINIACLHKLCENTPFDINVEADEIKLMIKQYG